MNSGDTRKLNIRLNTSIIDDLENATDAPVRSLDPVARESVNLSYQSGVGNSLSVWRPAYGGPLEAKALVTEALVAVGKALNPDISEESLNIIKSFVQKAERGPGSALPLICKGMLCPFLHVCVIHQAKQPLPVGSRCPLELSLVSLWVNKHLKALGINDVDAPENSFDMDMLYELATQELIRYRCSAYLSKNPEIVENKMVGESFNGTPIFADIMNPVLEAMDKAGRNVSKIREALLATRKAQVTAGQVILDHTEHAAKLREQARELINKRRSTQENLRDAEFKIKDEPTT